MSDCLTCRHCKQRQVKDTWQLRQEGYTMGNGYSAGLLVHVCTLRKLIAPTPCQAWEREPGSDDGMDAEPTMEG